MPSSQIVVWEALLRFPPSSLNFLQISAEESQVKINADVRMSEDSQEGATERTFVECRE